MPEINSLQHGKRPVSLWDIDGVFLLHADKEEGYIPPKHYVAHNSIPYYFYSPLHAGWLRRYIAMTDAYYISSRHGNLHASIGTTLGVPEIDWVNDCRDDDSKPINGHSGAADAYFPDRAVAIITDDLVPQLTSWAEDRNARGIPTLIVGTHIQEGLEIDHVQRLEHWLGELSLI